MIRETEESTSSTSDDLEMSGKEEIGKEIVKLKYFADQTDKLLEDARFLLKANGRNMRPHIKTRGRVSRRQS